MTIDPATANTLFLIGIVAALATVAAVAREHLRPSAPGDWSERDFGDQPHVNNLFHSGTINTGAKRDHV